MHRLLLQEGAMPTPPFLLHEGAKATPPLPRSWRSNSPHLPYAGGAQAQASSPATGKGEDLPPFSLLEGAKPMSPRPLQGRA